LSDAEGCCNIDYVTSTEISTFNSTPPKQFSDIISESLSPIFNCSPQKAAKVPLGETIKTFISAFKGAMSTRLQKQLLQHLYQHLVVSFFIREFLSFICST
jgi:hypothetical protein